MIRICVCVSDGGEHILVCMLAPKVSTSHREALIALFTHYRVVFNFNLNSNFQSRSSFRQLIARPENLMMLRAHNNSYTFLELRYHHTYSLYLFKCWACFIVHVLLVPISHFVKKSICPNTQPMKENFLAHIKQNTNKNENELHSYQMQKRVYWT